MTALRSDEAKVGIVVVVVVVVVVEKVSSSEESRGPRTARQICTKTKQVGVLLQSALEYSTLFSFFSHSLKITK